MAQSAIARHGLGMGAGASKGSPNLSFVRRRRFPIWLFFPFDAKVLRTTFRASVLQTIYEVARDELGSSLVSAVVSTWKDPEEPVPPILILSIIAESERAELKRARFAILNTIASESVSWTEKQKSDYSKTIYFELEPSVI